MDENPSTSLVQSLTTKGVKCIVVNGLKYRYLRKMASGALTFRCTNKNCTSRVSTDPDLTKVLEIGGTHSHDGASNSGEINSGASTSGASNYKRKSSEQLNDIPSKTVIKESNTLENTSMVLDNVGADTGDDDNDIETITVSMYNENLKLLREKSKSLDLEEARKEAKMQAAEMSHKKYVGFGDFGLDDDGNECIILPEPNTFSEPVVSRENNQYNYIYPSNETSNRAQLMGSSGNNEQNPSTSITFNGSATTSSVKVLKKSEWKEEEVRYMMKIYKEFIPCVGQNNKFKNKTEMWDGITKEINDKFHVDRTSVQCINKFYHRYQTLKRPKKLEGEIINFQDEIETLDSLHEVIMEDLEASIINELEVQGREITNPEAALGQILPKTLIELAKINAHAEERRHREYMDFIKGFEARFMNNVSKVLNKLV